MATSSTSSSFDGPQVVMWATLLVGLAAAAYELMESEYEIAMLVGIAGFMGWAILRLLVQIRSATRSDD